MVEMMEVVKMIDEKAKPKRIYEARFSLCSCPVSLVLQGFQASELVTMVAVAAKSALARLRPAAALLQPVAAQELTDACVVWLALRRLHRH